MLCVGEGGKTNGRTVRKSNQQKDPKKGRSSVKFPSIHYSRALSLAWQKVVGQLSGAHVPRRWVTPWSVRPCEHLGRQTSQRGIREYEKAYICTVSERKNSYNAKKNYMHE